MAHSGNVRQFNREASCLVVLVSHEAPKEGRAGSGRACRLKSG